jgi:hypothetical protein
VEGSELSNTHARLGPVVETPVNLTNIDAVLQDNITDFIGYLALRKQTRMLKAKQQSVTEIATLESRFQEPPARIDNTVSRPLDPEDEVAAVRSPAT